MSILKFENLILVLFILTSVKISCFVVTFKNFKYSNTIFSEPQIFANIAFAKSMKNLLTFWPEIVVPRRIAIVFVRRMTSHFSGVGK